MKEEQSHRVLLQGPVKNGLYVLPAATLSSSPQLHLTTVVTPLCLHRRLGHPSSRITDFVFRSVTPSPKRGPLCPKQCEECSWAKAHALPHKPSPSRSSSPFHLLFLDVWGPAHTKTLKGNMYYLSIVDDYSRFIWIFPFTTKSLVANIVSKFITFATKFFSTKISYIQTDGGTEFKPLIPLFQNLGIAHRLTCPYSHQQNGSVETRHRRIVDSGLTLLKQASLPLHF